MFAYLLVPSRFVNVQTYFLLICRQRSQTVDQNREVNKGCFHFSFFLEQELEQELAEQKNLLRSVASHGEEILTQHSAAETSGSTGYVSKVFIHSVTVFLTFEAVKQLRQNSILNICRNVLFPFYFY